MGPVRSFLTALFLKIKDRHLRYRNGKYFDIMYGKTLQKPILDMSGSHIEYIPEMCYFYNKDLPSHVPPREHDRKVKKVLNVLKREKYDKI